MKVNELSFMVGGPAGLGIKTAGLFFARLCSRAGLHVFGNVEYPSIIRGDHNSFQVMVSEQMVHGHLRAIDVLLALDARSIEEHRDAIRPGGALIFNREKIKAELSELEDRGVTLVGLPFQSIIENVEGSRKLLNTVGISAAMGLLGFGYDAVASGIEDLFGSYGESVVKQNLGVAQLAYDAAAKDFAGNFGLKLEQLTAPRRMLLTGNEALAMGAIKAGVKFYAGYPMTPSSSILNYLAKRERKYGLVVKHAEDEIAAAGMAVGASFAGVRAMTATSGGGFCLMTECLGLAAITETPLVIAECQRPGPATGLPTRTEQADLKFVLAASQGEFARIVIAPGDLEESFRLGFDAFNLADKYQTPVIVLMDKHLSESTRTCQPFDCDGMEVKRGLWLDEAALTAMDECKRYEFTESGVSPMLRPGTPGGVVTVTADEHDEYGLINEDEDIRVKSVDKRLRKLSSLDVSQCGWKLHGPERADLTIVAWGSTKSPVLGAMALLESEALSVNFLQVIFMSPFPTTPVADILGAAKKVVLVENNATAQLADVIAQHTQVKIADAILKYSGRQFLVDELAEELRKRL